jgi:hypothetical protein
MLSDISKELFLDVVAFPTFCSPKVSVSSNGPCASGATASDIKLREIWVAICGVGADVDAIEEDEFDPEAGREVGRTAGLELKEAATPDSDSCCGFGDGTTLTGLTEVEKPGDGERIEDATGVLELTENRDLDACWDPGDDNTLVGLREAGKPGRGETKGGVTGGLKLKEAVNADLVTCWGPGGDNTPAGLTEAGKLDGGETKEGATGGLELRALGTLDPDACWDPGDGNRLAGLTGAAELEGEETEDIARGSELGGALDPGTCCGPGRDNALARFSGAGKLGVEETEDNAIGGLEFCGPGTPDPDICWNPADDNTPVVLPGAEGWEARGDATGELKLKETEDLDPDTCWGFGDNGMLAGLTGAGKLEGVEKGEDATWGFELKETGTADLDTSWDPTVGDFGTAREGSTLGAGATSLGFEVPSMWVSVARWTPRAANACMGLNAEETCEEWWFGFWAGGRWKKFETSKAPLGWVSFCDLGIAGAKVKFGTALFANSETPFDGDVFGEDILVPCGSLPKIFCPSDADLRDPNLARDCAGSRDEVSGTSAISGFFSFGVTAEG